MIGVDEIEGGYSTHDDSYWGCKDCFIDFEKLFSLNILHKSAFADEKITSVISNEIESVIKDIRVYKINKLVSRYKKVT